MQIECKIMKQTSLPLTHRVYQIQCAQRVSVITFIWYAQNQNTETPSKLKVFESNNSKRAKQDSQNRLRSHMSEGGEP
jgi:uncharacterized protein with von Willebrand factor type A (vWA) domain